MASAPLGETWVPLITSGRKRTCWITFTKSLRALRLDRVMMTAVARYRKMCGHMVWIAFRYLQTQNMSNSKIMKLSASIRTKMLKNISTLNQTLLLSEENKQYIVQLRPCLTKQENVFRGDVCVITPQRLRNSTWWLTIWVTRFCWHLEPKDKFQFWKTYTQKIVIYSEATNSIAFWLKTVQNIFTRIPLLFLMNITSDSELLWHLTVQPTASVLWLSPMWIYSTVIDYDFQLTVACTETSQ
jgi:hypothetical protein